MRMTGPEGDIVRQARQAGVAILAFNIPYLPMLKPVVEAVVAQDSVAMIAVARLEWLKFESDSPAAVRAEFERWQQPGHVWLHMDHVPVIDEDGLRVDYLPVLSEAARLGYRSLMVDGSRLPLAENTQATRAAVDLAHAAGLPCEAELGAILGHEAGPLPPYEELFTSGRGFTDPQEAAQFSKQTGCDWLSVAVGNIHGAIAGVKKDQKKVEARLNLERIQHIAQITGLPLVLHGGSGIRSEDVRAAIQCGIAKVNIGTEIRQAYEQTLRETDSLEKAQAAVYTRTTWLIRDYFGLAGIKRFITT
jgi:fructose-bisphosphate aldolase, class II